MALCTQESPNYQLLAMAYCCYCCYDKLDKKQNDRFYLLARKSLETPSPDRQFMIRSGLSTCSMIDRDSSCHCSTNMDGKNTVVG